MCIDHHSIEIDVIEQLLNRPNQQIPANAFLSLDIDATIPIFLLCEILKILSDARCALAKKNVVCARAVCVGKI